MSNKTLHMKAGHMKVLAKDSEHPYFSVSCPCSQQPLTGKWFMDYFSYYPRSRVKLELYEFPSEGEHIPQTYYIQRMQSLDGNFRASAITINQPFFYNSQIYGEHGLDNNRTEIYYRTKELEISGNNLTFQQEMYKELNWWANTEDSDVNFVSGNATSAIAYNFNLSTNCQTFTISQAFITEQSGIISSIIINNVDNLMQQGNFITGYPIHQYSLRTPDGANYQAPILTDPFYVDYVPINSKSYANNQFFANRVYKGTQYGYVYASTPAQYLYYHSQYELVNDDYYMCGDDDPPFVGKTVYFETLGTYIYYVRKIGNKYYNLSRDDQKTIVEVPSSNVVSGVIQQDQPSIVKVTTGLVVATEDYFDGYPLLSSTDGLMLEETNGVLYPLDQFAQSQMGERWSNYAYYVNGSLWGYTTKIDGQSGQYYVEDVDVRETIDGIDYRWYYYVCFPKEYNTATSEATMNVYRFGYDRTNYVYTSAFTTSTALLTAKIQYWDEDEGPEPTCQWDSTLSCFYYPSGTAAHKHPDYMDMYVDIYHYAIHPGEGSYNDTERFYIYKAPAWAGLLDFGYQSITFNEDYLITGSTYDNIRVWQCVDDYGNPLEPDEFLQTTISTGWWTQYSDIMHDQIYLVLSSQNYWYVDGMSSMVKGTASQLSWVDSETIIESGYYDGDVITAILNFYPLTGGTLFNPLSSCAVDDPTRPPYWWYPYQCYHANIISGKYFIDHYNRVCPIVPLYYDSYYGHPINSYSIDDYVVEHWNAIDQEYRPNSAYYMAKNLINDYAYTYCNPFIKYVETEYTYDSGQDKPTITEFFENYLDEDCPTTGEVLNSKTAYMFDSFWGEYSSQRVAKWGGNGYSGNLQYRTRTQKFVKMTADEINDPTIVYTSGASAVDKALSGALNLQTGIYCQILTGFWLRNKQDERDAQSYNNVRGIRKSGVFYATLDFDTEYKFGFDLTNTSQLNDLLSSDSSTCFTYANNTLVNTSTTVSAYWAAMSASLQPSTKVNSANFSKFYSYCYIRPISGVFATPQP